MYFQDMCHGCGGCFEVCPEQALRVAQRELGALLLGSVSAGGKTMPFLMGRTRVGEAMTPPLLRAQERKLAELLAGQPSDVLMDAPPGVSCPAMTAARGADAVLLVAEPTPFGFYDFKLAHAAFAQLGRPVAVGMNRVGMEGNADCEDELRAWCAGAKLPILAELPFQREAAHAYAHGLPPTEAQGVTGQEWRQRFAELAARLRKFAKGASHVPESGIVPGKRAAPEDLLAHALANHAQTLAFTYNEPTVFFELLYETAGMAAKKGIRSVLVTNGYMSKDCLTALSRCICAANVDLKSFSEAFYRKYCGGHLQPVLENLKAIKKLGWWLEVTTLVIPGLNDGQAEMEALAAFIRDELGPDTPWLARRANGLAGGYFAAKPSSGCKCSYFSR